MVDNVSKNKFEMGDEFLTALVVFAWQTLSVAFNYTSRSLLQKGKSSAGNKSFSAKVSVLCVDYI